VTDLDAWHPDLRPPDERTALEQFLDHYRHIVTSKLAELDPAQASARVLEATDLTVGGIVKHLAWAEDRWFQGRLLGLDLQNPAPPLPWPRTRTGRSTPAGTTRSTRCCPSMPAPVHAVVPWPVGSIPDAVAAVPSFGKGPVNLRWILVHMIDETARHAGHLDLLRDAIDRAASN
jgi:Protein of unknown function (DUF664)